MASEIPQAPDIIDADVLGIATRLEREARGLVADMRRAVRMVFPRTPHFVVFRAHGDWTVCVLCDRETREPLFWGVSRRHPNDPPNRRHGRVWALRRAIRASKRREIHDPALCGEIGDTRVIPLRDFVPIMLIDSACTEARDGRRKPPTNGDGVRRVEHESQ